MFASIRPTRDALARVARLRHRDPVRRATWVSDISRRVYYTPPDWQMHDVPVEGGFGMDVTRCVVAEFFDSLGMSRLCVDAICDQDARVAAHHGIAFSRSGTLAEGADRCDFRYHLTPQVASRAVSGSGVTHSNTAEVADPGVARSERGGFGPGRSRRRS